MRAFLALHMHCCVHWLGNLEPALAITHRSGGSCNPTHLIVAFCLLDLPVALALLHLGLDLGLCLLTGNQRVLPAPLLIPCGSLNPCDLFTKQLIVQAFITSAKEQQATGVGAAGGRLQADLPFRSGKRHRKRASDLLARKARR